MCFCRIPVIIQSPALLSAISMPRDFSDVNYKKKQRLSESYLKKSLFPLYRNIVRKNIVSNYTSNPACRSAHADPPLQGTLSHNNKPLYQDRRPWKKPSPSLSQAVPERGLLL